MTEARTLDDNKLELGNLIRQFRQTQVQIHSGHPWTQEDLGVAIGSDKTHVNRLEKGKQVPSPQTLNRISTALGLSWSQRRKLMALAGHFSALPSPVDSEVQQVIDALHPHLVQVSHPVILQDMELNTWDLNDLEAYTFYGYKTREAFLEDCQGFKVIELLMTPSFNTWFEKVIVDYDFYLRRQIMRFMDLYTRRQHQEEYKNIVKRLMKISDFKKIWLEVQEHREPKAIVPFLNHQILAVNHPDLGRFEFQIWHCDVALDERFRVIQHIANDSDTQQMFLDLFKKYQDG